VVLPAGHRSRVRALQTHRRVISEAQPVSRVALNLAGLERAMVVRGDAVVFAGQWKPATELDVLLRAVRSSDHPLTNRGAFKAYVGSAEVDARLSLYETARLGPGEETFARLILGSPVVAAPGDRFVLRDTGRRATVGGGRVLDPHPSVLRGPARAGRIAQLQARAQASLDDFPTLCVTERGWVERADLGWLSGSDTPPANAVSLRTLEVSAPLFRRLTDAIEVAVASFHRAHPLVRGMGREEAREAAGITNPRLFTELVEAMSDQITAEGPLLRSKTHVVTLTLEQEAAREVLLGQLAGAAFSPPGLQSLIDAHGGPLVQALIDAGALVRISDNFVFSAEQLEQAKRIIAEGAEREGPLTAARIKELLGTSRKYAIPLLEYLDSSGFTRRRGDLRELVR
jgi:selenocysteine-specific elongation factor